MISTIRHQEILDPQKYANTPITVIGVGATGSHLVMSLIELGFTNITMYDDDVVEPHNLANQAYEQQDIGETKISSLQRLIEAKLGEVPRSLTFIEEKVTSETELTGVVFLLTDTMESRHEIATAVQNKALYVLETRMASSYGNIFGFDPNVVSEFETWHSTLSTDEDTEVSSCGSAISVGPTAKITANLAVWHLINYLTDHLAVDPRIDFFLKPAAFNVGALA
jgi:molybdopterin/thiamine biosynthesis adenylyltransferase